MVERLTIYWIFLILATLSQLGAAGNDPAANQLPDYGKTHEAPPLTSDSGHPLDTMISGLSVGPYGPMLLDNVFLESIAKFNRERIPERVVHAKGAGAFGEFEVTHDISKYTKAKLFEKVGKKTPVLTRFSFATGLPATSDTVRDVRGFATKFYTEEGNWDLVGNAIPVFFFSDPSVITMFAHSAKGHPRTNIREQNALWDFFTSRPETMHGLLYFLGDPGIPDGYRHLDGFGVNTFKLVNDKNEIIYAKFTLSTNQGIKTLTTEQAANISMMDPDYATRDLFNAIAKKEYPSWNVYIQVMTPEEAAKYRWNPFDVTKVWYEKDYPLMPVGKLVLNRNPTNHFAEIEEVALCPANLVPGIEPSPDISLQGRIFAYADAQRYRLGINYPQLPVNYPYKAKEVRNYNRDGSGAFYNQGDAPNYYPNIYHGPKPVPSAAFSEYNVSGTVKRYDVAASGDNYSQPKIYWNEILKPDEKQRIIANIVLLTKPTEHIMQVRVAHFFYELNQELGETIAKLLNLDLEEVKAK